MQHLQHILAPTDFSHSANSALVYVLHLAERINAKVHLAHVNTEENRLTEADIREKFKWVVHDYLATRKVSYEIHQRSGAVKKAIDDLVKEQHIDLIVLGMQGTGYQEGAGFGRLTAALITAPPCAIISIPRQCTTLSLSHIVVSSDLRAQPPPSQLYVLTFLAEALKAEISIFYVDYHVMVPNESSIKKHFDALFQHNVHSFHEVTSDNYIMAVNMFVKENKADLVTVFHRMKMHKDPMHRSTSKQLAFASKKPLLIIPINDH